MYYSMTRMRFYPKVISLLPSPATPARPPGSRGNNRDRQGERAGVSGAGNPVALAG